jgi:hypothetical protein
MMIWLWMFIAGIGIGPSMAVFTVVVQNAVTFAELGAATSDLTLFRQIGGTVGLTFAFTLFRNFLSWDAIRTQLIARDMARSRQKRARAVGLTRPCSVVTSFTRA